MKHTPKRVLLRVSVLATSAAVLALTAFAGVANAAPLSHKKLSAPTISIGSNSTSDFGLLWIAHQAGFFKKNGLNVNFVLSNGGTSAGTVAAFLSGAYDLINTSAATLLPVRLQGAPIEALVSDDEGQDNGLTITQQAAAQFHIPAADNTKAQVIAQIKALKGSHLQLGLSTVSSPGAAYAEAAFNKYGITWGLGCATCDVNESTVGSTTNQVAAFNAGKIQAFANGPEATNEGGSATYINFGLAPPLSLSSGLYVAAQDSFVEQHPDTIQAFTNSFVEAWAYAKLHPVPTERMFATMQSSQSGVTSPDTVQALWASNSGFWKTPLMLRSTFDGTESVLNQSQLPNHTSLQPVAAERFVAKSAKTLKLGIKVPTSI